ncbi:MAG: VWA domain-containing protein [Chloroflexi bacterium]|nr:VWA domain-containing protein [Chloroflexota bacterium]
MTVLAPLGLLLGLTLPILVVFYLLKVQPLNREVGSIYLWERLLPDLAAHQPWQRPRFPPLFFLQAALLLALAVAAGRPAIQALAEEGVSAVVVLDATASMNATDERPSRFARARELARSAIVALPEGSTATLILAGARPAVLIAETGDRAALLGALERAGPTDATGDLGDALRLAAALARSRAHGRIEVFTDGALDLPVDLLADLMEAPVPLEWHLVGQGATNRAITALSARADPQNQRRQQIFLRVQQFADAGTSGAGETRVTLAVHDQTGEQMIEGRPLSFDAEGIAETTFDDLPDAAQVVEVRLSDADALAVDDRARLVIERPRSTRVLLVSRGNLFLEKAVGLLPNVQLDRIIPRRLGSVVPDDYDILVLDTDIPDLLPSRPLLIVNPASSPFLPVEGQLRRPAITAWDREHPLLRHVELADVRLTRAPLISAPGWARPVVESAGAPLVLAGTEQGRRVVVLAFDLHQSNLPLTTAFPILIANAIGYLEPPGLLSASTVEPGAEISLSPLLEARSIVVRQPSGDETVLPIVGRTLPFVDTTRVGLYRVLQRDGERTLAESVFAVNLLNAGESDLRPRALPSAGPAGEPRPLRPTAYDRWAWLVVAAVGLLGVEWWWYHRK